jgi:small-conductance mechanosensitive channel
MTFKRLLMALLLLWIAGRSVAQGPTDAAAVNPSGAAPIASAVEAPVVVGNRTVTVFRAPYLGVAPERRAQRTQAILRELLDRAVQGAVTIQVEPQGHVLLVDGELALVLTPADVDPLRAQTLAQASAATRDALTQVLAETREGRDTRRLLWGLGRSLLATLVAAAIVLPAWRARRWATVQLAQRVAQSAAGVRVAGTELLHAERLVAAVRLAVRALWWLLALALAYEWLSYVLRQFPYTRPWGEGLTAYLFGVAARVAQGVLGALPDLVIALIIFLIARGVIALFRPFFHRLAATDSRQRGWLDADTAGPTRRLFNIAVWVFAAVMAYPYLPGAQSEAFKGVSLLIGLMVTLGGSSLFGQAASGLVLMYSRTLRVGEYVRIDDHEGTVTEMGTFVTRMRTGRGADVSQCAGARQRQQELLSRRTRARVRRRHDGDHRLRHAVAPGRGNAGRSGASHAGRAGDAGTACLPDRAVGLLSRVPAGLPGDPERAATARRGAECAARPHPGRVQRARRADHVAALPGRSGRAETGAARAPLCRAGASRRAGSADRLIQVAVEVSAPAAQWDRR